MHTAVECFDSFRKEFGEAITAMKQLIGISNAKNPNMHIPVLAMSATFRLPEQKIFNVLMGRAADLVSWGAMDKRSDGIFCDISGDPLNSLNNDLVAAAKLNPQSQYLLV